MCRAQLIVVLACALGVVDADVNPDWNKLTDFSAKFSAKIDESMFPPDMQQHQQNVHSYKASGEMNVDVFGERAYIRGKESYKLGAIQDHAEGHDEYEFYVDGVKGRVAFKFQGKFPAPLTGMPGDIVVEPSCAKVLLPQGVLPPPEMIKEQAEQSEPMVTDMLQQMPHTEVTLNGETVNKYEDPNGNGRSAFAIRDDATPVAAWFGTVDGAPQIEFTDWDGGAKVPDDMNCAEMSPEELLAKPYAKRSLRILDHVVALARRTQPLELAFRHLPAKPSLLFEGAAGANRSVQSSMPGMMSTMVLAFAAGTLASLLVFAVLKPRRSHGTPLLENA